MLLCVGPALLVTCRVAQPNVLTLDMIAAKAILPSALAADFMSKRARRSSRVDAGESL